MEHLRGESGDYFLLYILHQSDIAVDLWIEEHPLPKRYSSSVDCESIVTSNCSAGPKLTAVKTYGHINNWDVSKITDFSRLFDGSNCKLFNSDISNWDVSNGVDFSGMFEGNPLLETILMTTLSYDPNC